MSATDTEVRLDKVLVIIPTYNEVENVVTWTWSSADAMRSAISPVPSGELSSATRTSTFGLGGMSATDTEVRLDKVLVIIPTYNEVENVETIVARTRRANPNVDVLVADDNSPDGTGEIADRIDYHRRPERRRWGWRGGSAQRWSRHSRPHCRSE
jgi:cellulose synthase/poly-beta-1,6-N-acetylglucosamine synthase-like glycosyltransferase